MDTLFCTECGTPLEPGAVFCSECGHPVDRTETVSSEHSPASPPAPESTPAYTPAYIPTYTPPPPPGRRKGTWVRALVASLLVVCMLAGVTVAVLIQEDSKTTSPRNHGHNDDDENDDSFEYDNTFSTMISDIMTSDVASHPSYPPPVTPEEEWSDHLYLRYKDMGYCESLTGNVLFTFVFVSDSGSSWTYSALSEAENTLASEIVMLEYSSNSYGVDLSVSHQFLSASVSIEAGYDNDYQWSEMVMGDLGYGSVSDAQLALESSYDVDAAPIIFVLPKSGRPYAYPAESAAEEEYAVLYTDELNAFRHELFHLFGAEDYYYPDVVEQAVFDYLPNSIMWDSAGVLDDFTAYCIGWRDDLSDSAVSFLEATAHVTMDDINAALEEEQFTGYGSQWYGEDYYEGYLEMGVPNGTGIYVFADGDRYEGDFVDGYFHGNGTYTFSDGEYYVGEFQYDYFHGYGTYYFNDGTSWSGYWINDEPQY